MQRQSGYGKASPMLADVRVMRHDGRPIPRDQISRGEPRRGYLNIVKRRAAGGRLWIPIAVLIDPGAGEVLPPLEDVRVMRWRGADLVMVGVERVGRLKSSRPQAQSWWVRLVSPCPNAEPAVV